MTEKISYVEITGHGIARLIPAAIFLTLMAIPVVTFYKYTGTFLANHHDWSQDSNIGGILARFYESNFLEIIKNLNWKFRESGFFAKVGYVITAYLAMIIYLFIPPVILSIFTKNRIFLAVVTAICWALPIFLLGGFIYMVEIFSR